MAVVITDLGSSAAAGGLVTLTTSIDIPAGALVIAAISGLNYSAVTMLDPSSNVFSNAVSGGVQTNAALTYHYNSPFIASGSTFQCAANAGSPTMALSMFFATGMISATDPLDAGAASDYTTATPSKSITTVATNTLIVGAVGHPTTNTTTYTQSSGYTTPPSKNGTTTGTLLFVAGGNQILSSAGSQTYAPTLSASGNGTIALASFKIAPTVFPSGFFAFFDR